MDHLEDFGSCFITQVRDSALRHTLHELRGSWALDQNNKLRRELNAAGFTEEQTDLCWKACCEAVDVTLIKLFGFLDPLAHVELAADWEGDGTRQVLRLPSEDLFPIDLVVVYQDHWVPNYSEVPTDRSVEATAEALGWKKRP